MEPLIEIRDLLRNDDSFAAVEHIQRQGAPLDIAARYGSLVMDLYWKVHDLPAVVTLGRAGILYCLGQALMPEMPAEMAGKLRSGAKAMAYNVSSFVWPGWEEPGIDPKGADLAFGADCARLNLRLAIELKKPPSALSKAHWLVGAHALCSRDFAAAASEFQRAQDVLPAADTAFAELEPCNLGYLAVARLCQAPTDTAASGAFEQITSKLAADKSDDAQVYLTQLLAARRLFVPT